MLFLARFGSRPSVSASLPSRTIALKPTIPPIPPRPPFGGNGVAAMTLTGVSVTVSLAGVLIACCSIAAPLLPPLFAPGVLDGPRGVLIAAGVLMTSLSRLLPRAGVIETESRRRAGSGVCIIAIAACLPGVMAAPPGLLSKEARARFLGAGICITLRLPASGVGWNP